MQRIVILFIFVFLCGKIFSQADGIFRARVLNDSIPLEGVHVQNLHTQSYTTTNTDGYFTIRVSVGNALQLTYIGMKTTFRKINPEDFRFTEVEIQMKDEVTELEGVEISKYQKLTAKDLGILQHIPVERTIAEKRLYTSQSGLIGGINAILGKNKMLKKVIINERNLLVATHIRDNMADFLIKELKLNTEDIEILSYYVMERSEIHTAIDTKNDGELKFLLIDAWKEYQKSSSASE